MFNLFEFWQETKCSFACLSKPTKQLKCQQQPQLHFTRHIHPVVHSIPCAKEQRGLGVFAVLASPRRTKIKKGNKTHPQPRNGLLKKIVLEFRSVVNPLLGLASDGWTQKTASPFFRFLRHFVVCCPFFSHRPTRTKENVFLFFLQHQSLVNRLMPWKVVFCYSEGYFCATGC